MSQHPLFGPVPETMLLRERIAEVEAQRDELLEAVKALVVALEGYEWHSDMPEGEFHRLLDAANDALNRAEGRE